MRRSVWVVIATCAIAAALGLALLQQQPAGTFTSEQKEWLRLNRPGGHYVGTRYVWCDQRNGGFWTYYYANGDYSFGDRTCWMFFLPSARTLSPEYRGP